MRFKHKKLFISGTAVAAAGALGVGALLQTVLSVQASSDMMPGIEQIVSANTEDEPFRILELVNNSEDAEIGYYISGQEPSLKLYQYQYTDSSGNLQTVHFSSVQEALSKLPAAQRSEFMQNIKSDGSSTGIKNIAAATGDDGPLSYSPYTEKYFLDSGDTGWTKVDLTDFNGNTRTDTVSVNGSYQENSAGTGNYTKAEQQYYPIRNDVSSDKEQTEKYRENIQNFYPSESSDSRGAYYLEFAEVGNDKVNNALKKDNGKAEILPEYEYTDGRYGYYENVYTDLTKEIVDNIDAANGGDAEYQFPGENPVVFNKDDSVLIQNNTDEAVKSTIEESNSFTSGETVAGTEDTIDSSSQDDFSGNSGSNNGSTDFDSAFQSDEEDSFDGSDSDTFDSDISLEQQSYEEPVESSGADAFADDFSDQAADSEDSSVDVDTEVQNQEDTDSFTEDQTDIDSAEDAGDGTDQTDTQRKILGNIQNHNTAGTQANPYVYLGENIAEYPYYKYELIGDMEYVKATVETTANNLKNDQNYQIKAGDILLDNDQYWYYKDENGTLKKYPISVVTGRQPVAFNELQKIPEDFDYNYYYRVEKVYFCCKSVDNSQEDPSACAYFGWYYPSYPANEDAYLPVTDGKAATHYISAASYSLTPGKGNYDFVPGEDTSCQVQVNSFYYQGGYTNNDWFKKYVFHLSPKASEDEEDGEFENFGIEVDTKSAGNATDPVYAEAVAGEDTSAQSVSADDETVSIDAGDTDADSAAGTQQSDASDEVEFTSEYQEPDTQDVGETAEVAGDNDEAVVADENTDETRVDAEVDETTEDEADVQIEEDAASDAGDGESTDTLSDSLKEYDLIYLNGKPAKSVAEAIIASGVPCIVNAKKTSDDNVFKTAFSSVINSTDADGHYVNTNVYFFEDCFVTETGDDFNLVNVNFKTNFNENLESAEDISYGDEDAMQGFEEIIKYINSENQYRSLGNTSDAATEADESSVSDGNTDTESIAPLSREISQARAIEYIVNYKYKRAITGKKQINVLEIMPNKLAEEDLSKEKVLSWLNGEARDQISVCCYHTGNESDLLEDGKPGTLWEFAYNLGDSNYNHEGNHYIEVNFTKAESIRGFSYTPRQGFNLSAIYDGSCNGILKSYKAVLTYANGTTEEISGNVNITKAEKYDITFPEEQHSVKKMKIEFTNAYSSTTTKMASCAEFSVLYSQASDKTNMDVEFKRMTASEFVGHIDDIGSEYDLIYISDNNNYSSQDELITGAGNLRYSHVGSGLLLKWISNGKYENGNLRKLLGILDIDYYRNADGTRWNGQIWNDTYTNGGHNGYRFTPYSEYNENGAGYYRGSGNDITKQQYTELMNFVKSGYPVILGDGLVNSNGTVNSSEVGASSWYYQFMTDALKYGNVMTGTQAENNDAMAFYMNLAKPQIDFSEKPFEAPRARGLNEKDNTEKDGKQYEYIQDGQLKYVFTIANNSEVVPASTSYDCRLYIDLNFDGNMSEEENQQKYIQIQDETGNVLSRNSKGQYELKIGKQYTLVRKIPSDYYKVMNWKLEISSNRNSYIHVSETGYAKQKKNGEAQKINVLQLVPDSSGKENPCTWNLANDLTSDTTFKRLMSQVTDFSLNINQLMVRDISSMSYEAMKAKLDTQQMLIIGFADVYQDIPNNHNQVQAILEYIQSGRSVIFSHDTTSYVNYNKNEMNKQIGSYQAGDKNVMEIYPDGYLSGERVKNITWGLSLNSILRSVVGMDRYGVTSDEKIDTTYGNITVGELTRKGITLTDNKDVSFQELMKLAGDVAYTDNSKSTSYVQTQGYSNTVISGLDSTRTTKASKVNDGAITEYPFKLDDEIPVSGTHGQYYQLALERDDDKDGCNDVVVWYCLKGSTDTNGNNYNGENGYSQSPNDVHNNYYFYSKGNVIYTGAGHSKVNQEDEIKLFINAIVAAANVSAVDPDVNFVSELNPAAQVETSRYYMTDQSNWAADSADQGNVLEKDMQFYLNVKDYNMVSASLGSEDEGTEDMNVQFFIDTSGTQSGTLDESRLTSIMEEIDGLTTYGTGTVIGKSGNAFSVGNNAYAFTVKNIEQYLKDGTGGYKQNCKIYAKVTSNVTLYGKNYTKTKWASIDLKQRQLFEMD